MRGINRCAAISVSVRTWIGPPKGPGCPPPKEARGGTQAFESRLRWVGTPRRGLIEACMCNTPHAAMSVRAWIGPPRGPGPKGRRKEGGFHRAGSTCQAGGTRKCTHKGTSIDELLMRMIRRGMHRSTGFS